MKANTVAVKLFDDGYFVSYQNEDFHILRTGAGLVLFESVDISDADEKYLFSGLKVLELENRPINMK